MASRAPAQPQQDALSRTQASIRQTLAARRPQPHGLRASLRELQRALGNAHLQRMLGTLARSPEDHEAKVSEVSSEVESSIERARGGGRPLDEGVRGQMESAFGADFGGVRVHTGAESHALNRALQAQAFTTGSDIFFSSGAYQPSSSAGRHLLAHELTHVVQQSGAPPTEDGGPALQPRLALSQPSDADELAAEDVARSVSAALDSSSIHRVARSGAKGGCSCGGPASSAGGECEGCKQGPGAALDSSEEDESGKPNPRGTGDATIQCDGKGGWEIMLNGFEGKPCGIPGCITRHEQSHIDDWKAKWPDGCKGQARGYLPKGDPPDKPLMTVAEYQAFLKASECKAYTVQLGCANGLDKTGACKKTVEDFVDLSSGWKTHYC